MIKPLPVLHSQKNNSTFVVKQYNLLICFFAVLFTSGNVFAQNSKVVPENFVTGSFLGPLVNSARSNQLLIDDSQLTTLSGKYITSISFRLPTTVSNPWPATNTTFSDYQIYLSNSVDPANRQLNFAANVVGTQTQVRSGSLVIPAGSLTTGGNPNNFTFDIVFDTPYLYTGTNLLIEIRHTGSDGSSASTHAAGTSSPGYGTLFSACWLQSTGTVANANFSYVKINALDALGVKSVEFDDSFSVYPNPAKDFVYIKSSRDVVEFNVFNMVGQKIYSQKNTSGTTHFNVSSFSKGNYILQMIDKDGNAKTTKFIKE